MKNLIFVASILHAAPKPDGNTGPANPRTDAPVQNAAPTGPVLDPKNRFAKHFGKINFVAAKPTEKVWGDETRKSKKVAEVVIEIGETGAYIPGVVKAIKQGNKTFAEFTFFGALNKGQAVKVNDSDNAAAADLERYKAYVLAQYKAWSTARKASGATDESVDAAAVELDDVTF